MNSKKILIEDDFKIGLVTVTSVYLTSLMKKVHSQYGTTDITVTHDIKLARAVSDRIGLVENGRIVEIGSFDYLREKSNHTLIRSFVEMEERNE